MKNSFSRLIPWSLGDALMTDDDGPDAGSRERTASPPPRICLPDGGQDEKSTADESLDSADALPVDTHDNGSDSDQVGSGTTYKQTDIGGKRDTNEDSVLCRAFEEVGYHLIAVADGMGGHEGGEIASQTALDAVEESITTALSESETDREHLLEDGTRRAHEAVVEMTEANNFHREPGTTLITALLDGDDAVISNVGDSRAYVYDGSLSQVTTDQTQVQQLVEAGELDPEDAEDHRYSHVLLQAIGTADDLYVEISERSLAGGRLLLCSDGLTDAVSDDVIEETLETSSTIGDAGSTLIDRALAAGASDNVTLALYEVVE
ncbi:PP2C family protein-serine/threonine phosphatase [Salinigranum halophilum]|uniref:PP2C family protein-serine/threonine phosphatase n=1 Tax=Salinigranum halophilum TaxID=2565931 RepID=UPI00115F129C|nr:protein phosphatase 2C domain-containing protein [Salinigranum halophilum]